jgi:hypothetical protein
MSHVAELGVERRSWRALARTHRQRRPVPFPELVHSHALWRDALEGRRERLGELDRAYHETRAHFERVQGSIVSEFWCSRVPSAVCLTARHSYRGSELAFHRTTDWATEGLPEIAEQLHRCDRIAARATHVLSGVRRQICLRLVMSTASHLLSLADAPAAAKQANITLSGETRSLDDAEHYYREAATGQAQVVYFTGMALSAALFIGLAILGGLFVPLAKIDNRELYGCLAAGAIGAVVSVLQRINSGRFDLEYDVGRAYVTFLGALRPAIGAVFGLVIYFAVSSRIVKLFELPAAGTPRLYALLVIAFIAGFSERWAQDTLTSLTGGGTTPAKGKQDQPRPLD